MRKATPTPPRFDGFADRDARFFRALARNQRRDWFEAHRREYEEGWLRPMQGLLAEVRDRVDRFFPHHPLRDPKVFRIHRDVRFSKDKAPYKTHVGGYVALAGGGDADGPAAAAPLYLHVGATETFACAGQYVMDPAQLARFRAAVADERQGSRLAGILAPLGRRGFGVGSHETLRKVPRGMDPDHPRADLLKRKGLIVTFPELPRDLLVSRRLVDWLVGHAERTAPLVAWLAAIPE
jgi:uncharacterized protein (TIGR02453 family)